MKKYLIKSLPYILITIALTVILITAGWMSRKSNYVNGYNHIYRGQILDLAYYPKPLIKLSARASYLNTDQYLAMPAKLAVEMMINDAERDGLCLIVLSGYRSPVEQQKLLDFADPKDKIKIASAGQSEHQTGLAVDLGGCPMSNGTRNDNVSRDELKNSFDTLPEYQWLLQNASKYGFEQSFTKENEKMTGYPYEPWHFKFLIK